MIESAIHLLKGNDLTDIRELMTDDGRFYMRDGIVLPSITTILKHTGDKSFLDRWRARIGDEEADRISREARERGTLMHAFAEDFLTGKRTIADIPSSDKYVLFYDKVQKFLAQNITKPIMMETALHSPRLGVAGRVDLVALHNTLGTVTIDYKGTTNLPKIEKWLYDYHTQIAAYSIMLRESHDIKIDRNIVVVVNGLFLQTSIKKPGAFLVPLLNRIAEFKSSCSHMVPSPEQFS